MPVSEAPLHTASAALVAQHADRLAALHLTDLFACDSQRTPKLSRDGAGLRLDFSRQLIDDAALAALLALAREARIEERLADLCSGFEVNGTERRPALHTLLRADGGGELAPLFAQVQSCQEQMEAWCARIRGGRHRGFTGQAIADVVNIGIGGSDLGPRMVSEAMAAFSSGIRCHYAANVDPADLRETLACLDPQSTLFIVCSKSFRTEETLANALAARDWLRSAGTSDSDMALHMLAVTTNLEAAAQLGIPPENCLPMWDWVGGRYSVWSAVGLSCALAMGWENFQQFLAGARAMDRHAETAPLEANLPVLASLLEIWCCHFQGAENYVVLPYAHRLRRLAEFLQQLTMESNGKRVDAQGQPLAHPTAPVLWGAAGTPGQHSFHQLLHQGTRLCPVDFILPLASDTDGSEPHGRLVANCLAQSRALTVGRTEQEAHTSLRQRGLDDAEAQRLAPHLAMPGNRPHNIISFDRITPHRLGALLALYEHRTYCSSVLWGINAFDQWGVELGKQIGEQIHSAMVGDSDGGRPDLDPLTARLIADWRAANP